MQSVYEKTPLYSNHQHVFVSEGFAQTKIDYPAQPFPDSCVLYASNVATPDCDAVGCDYWQVYMTCEYTELELTVYNRWGEVLFQTTDINKAWYIGDRRTNETCVWQLTATDANGNQYEARGAVTVLV